MMHRFCSNDFLGGFVAGSYVEAMGCLVAKVFGYFCECTIITVIGLNNIIKAQSLKSSCNTILMPFFAYIKIC